MSRQDRSVTFATSVFRVVSLHRKCAIPEAIRALVPHEDLASIQSGRHTQESFVEAAGLFLDKRLDLVRAIVSALQARQLSQEQTVGCAMLVFKSNLVLLFCDLEKVGCEKVCVFVKALVWLMNCLDARLLDLAHEFFANFYARVSEIEDLSVVISFLPAVTEFVGRSSELGRRFGAMNLRMELRTFEFIHQQEAISDSDQESLASFSIAVAKAYKAEPNFEKEELTKSILSTRFERLNNVLLIACLELLVAFHCHNGDLIPLVRRVCKGFVVETDGAKEENLSEQKRELGSLYEIPVERSQYAIQCSDILSSHFLQCRPVAFYELMCSMINSSDLNVFAVAILSVRSLGQLRQEIAAYFNEKSLWSNVLSNAVFNPVFDMIDTPGSAILNLRVSVFEALSFLAVDGAIMNIRRSFVRLLEQSLSFPKLICEILVVSSRYCPAIFTVEHCNDNLFYLILDFALAEKDQEKTESIADEIFGVVFNVLESKLAVRAMSESIDACERLFSLLYYPKYNAQAAKALSEMFDDVDDGSDDPFAKAVYLLFQTMYERNDGKEILEQVMSIIHEKDRMLIAKPVVIMEIVEAIFYGSKTGNTAIMEKALTIIGRAEKYPQFPAAKIPFSEIGKACQEYRKHLSEFVKNIAIRDDQIILPEALEMLFHASCGDAESYEQMLDLVISLCDNSICNRTACSFADIPSYVFQTCPDEIYEKAVHLFQLISETVCNRKSYEAFLDSILVKPSRIVLGMQCVLDIVKRGSGHVHLSILQFSGESSEIEIPSMELDRDHNSFVISASILVDRNSSGRHFFELRSQNHFFTLTFDEGALVLRTEHIRTKIRVDYPVGKWIYLMVLLKPLDGWISILVNGRMRAGYTYNTMGFTSGVFACHLFGKDRTTDKTLAIQVQTIEISNHSTRVDPMRDYDMLQFHELCRRENCSYVLRADYILENGLLYADNAQKTIRYMGTSIPCFTSFVAVLEATHAIDIFLALFSHVVYVDGLLDTLLDVLKVMSVRSKIVMAQLERANGFSIIESYLQRLSQSNLSVQLWEKLMDMKTELRGHQLHDHLLDSFARELLFNLSLWSRAKLDVQHQVVKTWQVMLEKEPEWAKRHIHLPFLLSAFEKYSESPDVMNRLAITERSLSSRHLSFNGTPVRDHKEAPPVTGGHAVEELRKTVQFAEIAAVAEEQPRRKIDIVHSVTQLSPLRGGSPISRSGSTSFVNGRSVIANKLLKLRAILLGMCRSVVAVSLSETDIACLFKAIRNAGNIDQTREVLELVDYIVSLKKYPIFKLDNEWLSLFLHSHEEVGILMLDIMSKLEEPDAETIDAVQMLLILQSERVLSTSDFSGSSVLVNACRLALGIHDPIILSEIVSAPLIVRSPKYIHFAIVLSLAAPLEIRDLFFKFMCNVCSNQSNLQHLAESSTVLSIFLLIYWVIEKCCEMRNNTAQAKANDVVFGGLPSFKPESFDYNDLSSLIKAHRRLALPLKFNFVNDEAVKIVVAICSHKGQLLQFTLDVIDSISLMTSVDLGQLRSRLLWLMIENIEAQQVEDVEDILGIMSNALFFHHTGFTNPAIQTLYHESEYYTQLSPRRSSRIGPEIPDLITLVNAYSGDTDDSAEKPKFSLEIGECGQWKDMELARRLILIIFNERPPKITYSIQTAMLLYFYIRFSDSETGPFAAFADEVGASAPKFGCLMQKAMAPFAEAEPVPPPPSWKETPFLLIGHPMKAGTRKRRSQSDAMFMTSPTAALAMLRNQVAKKLSLSDSEDSEGNSTSDASSGKHGPTSYQSESFRLFKRFAERKYEKKDYIDIHAWLVNKMKAMINLIPKGRGMFIRMVQKRNGQYHRHHLESQLKRDGDKYYKRSSVTITRLGVPVVLKRNIGFKRDIQSVKAFNSIQKTDFLHENVADSSPAVVHFRAQRIKVNRTIEGTLYIYKKRLEFLTTEAKSLDIDIKDVRVVLRQVTLQRKTAVEIFTKHYHTYFFNFASENDARSVFEVLTKNIEPQESLQKVTEKWVQRKITNFEYLLKLNYFSGRTFNSILTYPIFPWIVKDYQSASLDLENPETFRDLSKPIGALNAKRLSKLKELMANSIDKQSFLYQSSYSCSFHVCHYLVRLEPFSSLHISLQDGKFDCPSRLFSSVSDAYERVVGTSMNFRELIPEFFFCPDFLVNKNRFVFGEDVDDVVLPPWAEKPSDFIYWNRRALESDYVSARLNEWIDLIWGFKQTGEAATKADNSFDPRLYSDVWKTPRNAQDKSQIESLLAHVGQIPQQLFTTAHPKRAPRQVVQRVPVKLQVANSAIVAVNDRLSVFCADGKVKREDHEILRESLTRFLSTVVMSDGQIAIIFENSTDVAKTDGKTLHRMKRTEHIDVITCLCPLLDGVVTGGRDGIVAWEHGSATYGSCPIICVSANDKLGLVAYLDEDRKITLLLASNFSYVRSFDLQIPDGAQPKKILFCDGYGYICVLSTDKSKSIISMYTLNGELIRGSGIESEIVVMESVSSPSTALDYLIFGDSKRRIAVSVAYEIEAATVLAETDSAITTIYYDSHNERILVGTQSGQVLQLSLTL